ncbi:MAG: ABC transporter ATP-binding protein [Sphingobacteriales bacterium]|jgi:ATP-binding cassette subfamily B multidrug efflux pump|nr:ABC transporter ATP-binding protein [Sphingobacteriales bacterium]
MSDNIPKAKVFDWDLLKRVIALARPYRSTLAMVVILSVITAALGPLRPYLIQQAIDKYVLIGDYNGLSRITALLFGLLLLESFLQYNFNYSAGWLGQTVIKDLRVRVFEHILRFKLRYFDTTPIGTSTTRAINDVETINDIFSEGMINIAADVLTIVMVVSIMFYSDWRLALVSLIPFPVLIYATYRFKENVKSSFQIVRTQVARLNAFLQEHITGMSIVQLFAAQKQEYQKFVEINEVHTEAHIKSIWAYSVFFPVVEIIIASSWGLLVWWGAGFVIHEKSSLGMLVAFLMYLNMLFRPMRMLADKFNTLQMGLVASERVFGILDRNEIIENTGTIARTAKGDIAFKNVWFAYDQENFVLRDVSFSIKAGTTLAIVGATGAGKSSIINILNRFYEIQKGQILLDDAEIHDYELDALRANIGLVLQDVFLFSGSIYENITLRNHSISRQKVIEAAKMVGAHDFIMQLPNNYDYPVMERGAMLSLGQRQLISFIRALVFDPRILILDEATSSIDTETEWMVQQAIERLIKNRTSIVIAHRLSTIQNAHQIMVLDKGKVVEIGTPEQLLANPNGHYRKLYDTQFIRTAV